MEMDTATLIATMESIQEMQKFVQCFSFSETEKAMVEHLYQMVHEEAQKRGLDGTVSKFGLNADGTFSVGREELKRNLKQLDFDSMMEFIDKVLEQPLTEEQRTAMLELAREIVLEGEA
ncbi:MAG: hypothetical protein J6Y91_03165 [Alphaproteobacteria bacterium]|nr:hypothetical protein [Alphaproteobacteria bacterium]